MNDISFDAVTTTPRMVYIEDAFKIEMKISGGVSAFSFPFSNESLTEKLLQFLDPSELGV